MIFKHIVALASIMATAYGSEVTAFESVIPAVARDAEKTKTLGSTTCVPKVDFCAISSSSSETATSTKPAQSDSLEPQLTVTFTDSNATSTTTYWGIVAPSSPLGSSTSPTKSVAASHSSLTAGHYPRTVTARGAMTSWSTYKFTTTETILDPAYTIHTVTQTLVKSIPVIEPTRTNTPDSAWTTQNYTSTETLSDTTESPFISGVVPVPQNSPTAINSVGAMIGTNDGVIWPVQTEPRIPLVSPRLVRARPTEGFTTMRKVKARKAGAHLS